MRSGFIFLGKDKQPSSSISSATGFLGSASQPFRSPSAQGFNKTYSNYNPVLTSTGSALNSEAPLSSSRHNGATGSTIDVERVYSHLFTNWDLLFGRVPGQKPSGYASHTSSYASLTNQVAGARPGAHGSTTNAGLYQAPPSRFAETQRAERCSPENAEQFRKYPECQFPSEYSSVQGANGARYEGGARGLDQHLFNATLQSEAVSQHQGFFEETYKSIVRGDERPLGEFLLDTNTKTIYESPKQSHGPGDSQRSSAHRPHGSKISDYALKHHQSPPDQTLDSNHQSQVLQREVVSQRASRVFEDLRTQSPSEYPQQQPQSGGSAALSEARLQEDAKSSFRDAASLRSSRQFFQSELKSECAPTSQRASEYKPPAKEVVAVQNECEFDEEMVQYFREKLFLYKIKAEDLFDEVFTDQSLSKISKAFFLFKIETIALELAENEVDKINKEEIEAFFELCDLVSLPRC